MKKPDIKGEQLPEIPQLKLIDTQVKPQENEIVCYYCDSHQYVKRGKQQLSQKRRYKCKNCGRYFTEGNIDKKLVPYQDLSEDVWDATTLGFPPLPHSQYKKLIFHNIKQDWLKEFVKQFILYQGTSKEFGTLRAYISSFNVFSKFLDLQYPSVTIEDVNRPLILDYLKYLNNRKSQTVKIHRLSTLNLFFKTGVINEWFRVTEHIIRKEDFPKETRRLPRYIPDEVIKQLNKHLDALPESVMRMLLVIQETGMRISELCLLNFDCLKQDGKGGWLIQFFRWKMKKEDIIPVSDELAVVIKEQQNYIRENLGNNFNYLFSGRKQQCKGYDFIPKPTVMGYDSFRNFLKRLVSDFEICERSGKPWKFQTHQFRHTVGTRMINSGVPLHIIQRYLGHETPEMTMRYAYIHDETLRKEVEKYHESRVVNFQAETVELEKTILSSDEDLEWFKNNVQARALEHGYCARPKVLGDCNLTGFDGCYNCPHWRTNQNFLPVLKDTLERTNKVLKKAQDCGWTLQINKNKPIQENLQKVIKSLESDHD
ncbi:MAG: tyrosine-type recombinase/integrase [Scytonema sp. PMC 1069.18]|nr:tyrosine-type recombinase/integrase [Scytonema sp. PMC 1069.18]MEC4888173.1 tyrosine-type recombinase/integrase [Scytonema sp. PMC 1070.18]